MRQVKRRLSIFLKISSLLLFVVKLIYCLVFLGTIWIWLPLYLLRKALTKTMKYFVRDFLGGRNMNKTKLVTIISVLFIAVAFSTGCSLEPVSGGGSVYEFSLFDTTVSPATYRVEDSKLYLELKSKYSNAGLKVHYNLNYDEDHKRADRNSPVYQNSISLNEDWDSLRVSFYLEIPSGYDGYSGSVYDLKTLYPNSKNGIADIKFSPAGGYFEDTVSVSLTCPSGNKIAVTLDGTDPKTRGKSMSSFAEYNSVTDKLDFNVSSISSVEIRAVGYDDSGSSDVYGNVGIHYYDLGKLESGKVAIPRIYVDGSTEVANNGTFNSSKDSLTLKFQSSTSGTVDIHYILNDGYKVEVNNGTSIFLENGFFKVEAWAEKEGKTRSDKVTAYIQTRVSSRDKLYLSSVHVGYDVYIASSSNNFPSTPNYYVRYQGLIVDERLQSFSPSGDFYIKIQDPATGTWYYPSTRNATLAGSNSMYNQGYSLYNLAENRFSDYWSNGSLWNLTGDNPYLASSVNVLN